jgi:intracellular sulfur oxidation DsrE/DsrF family protein
MKLMLKIVIGLSLVLGSALAQNSGDDIPWATPLIKGYGHIKYNPKLAIQPKKNMDYKVVEKVTNGKAKNGINTQLWHVARLMNLLYAGGVAKKNMHVVGVIAGKATPIVLSNAAYKKRFGADNPNMKLLRELAKHGAKIYVCSQALAEWHIDPKDVSPYIIISLSAITDLATFQLQGYVLIP